MSKLILYFSRNENTKLVSWAVGVVSIFSLCSYPALAETYEMKGPLVRLPVFYATDREELGPRDARIKLPIGDLKYGSASVTVPSSPNWQVANSTALRADLKEMNWTLDASSKAFVPFIEDRGYVAEKERAAAIEIDKPNLNFWSDLKRFAQASNSKTVYVYIHGFASSGINSVYAGGVLSSQVEAPVVVFSWPSSGATGVGLDEVWNKTYAGKRFAEEEKIIENQLVLGHLKTFLDQAQTNLGDVDLVLLAHSLGNRLMTRYFNSDPKVHFSAVYFIAADAHKEDFYKALPALKSQSKYTAVFSHPNDNVLRASWLKNVLKLNFQKKVGLSKFEIPDVDFIDYEEVAEPRKFIGNKKRLFFKSNQHYLKHYLPFEQFGSLRREGKPFSSVDKSFVLIKRSAIRSGNSKKGLFKIKQ